MIIRSKAPLRISFGGGGTDVSPYPEEQGGAVLNATIDKYAYCTLVTRDDDSINVRSLDYDIVVKYHANEEFPYDGKLDLVRAAIKVVKMRSGGDFFLHTDAPPGSGLGTSSAMTVTLVGALKHHLKVPLTNYDIAESAYHIEREEVGIKGGKQDQYAASFGGFNFIEFLGETTIVNPLRIEKAVLNELEYRLMLCYTGRTRPSAGIIEDQANSYIQKKESVVRALDETKQIAISIKNAVLLGQLNKFGALLHEGWENKKKFSPRITDFHIDELYEVTRQNGVIGGKLLGAGGGGYLLLFCEFDKRHIVAQKIEELGGQVIDFALNPRGLETWEVNNGQ